MLPAFKRYERVGVGIFLIGGEVLAPGFLPYFVVDLREKGIRVEIVMNDGEIDAIRKVHGLTVNFRAAANKYLILILAQRQTVFNGLYHLAAGNGNVLPGNNDIAAAGQRLANRIKSFAAHDDGASRGDILKMLQIIRHMPKKLVVFTDGVVFAYGDDDRDGHG